MVHQVAMLNGVMRGVRSLLAKLAPASIEVELGNPRRRAAGGSTLGPFRYKTLWELYTEIYGDFAEEKQATMLIFGPEFVHAYSELAGDSPAAGPGAGGSGQHAFGLLQGAPPPANVFPQPPSPPIGRSASSPAHGAVAPPPMVAQPPVTHPPQQGAPPNAPPAPPPMVQQPPQQPGPWQGGGPWPGGGPPRR
jgi:hypothetical protein